MSDSFPRNLNCFPNSTASANPSATPSLAMPGQAALRRSIPHQLWIHRPIACRRMHFGGNSFSQSQAFAAANAISHPISDIDRRLASGCPQREISQIDHTCWTNSSGRLLINTSNGAVPHDLAPLPSSSYMSVLYICIRPCTPLIGI